MAFASSKTPPALIMGRWIEQKERGAQWTMHFMVWLCRGRSRWVADALLYPITLYFFITAGKNRAASRHFFERSTGRYTPLDHYRQLLCFARSLLDRVAILSGAAGEFTVVPHGREQLHALRGHTRGGILLGSHLGSFEAARILLKDRTDTDIHIVAYFARSEKIRRALDAINPELALNVIDPSAPDAIFQMRDVIENGGILAILGDRTGIGEKRLPVDFLGDPTELPAGPYFLASILGCPVYCFFGVRVGTRRYESHLFKLADQIQLQRGQRDVQAREYAQAYADRLAEMARRHPYNWFNFFEFWPERKTEAENSS